MVGIEHGGLERVVLAAGQPAQTKSPLLFSVKKKKSHGLDIHNSFLRSSVSYYRAFSFYPLEQFLYGEPPGIIFVLPLRV